MKNFIKTFAKNTIYKQKNNTIKEKDIAIAKMLDLVFLQASPVLKEVMEIAISGNNESLETQVNIVCHIIEKKLLQKSEKYLVEMSIISQKGLNQKEADYIKAINVVITYRERCKAQSDVKAVKQF